MVGPVQGSGSTGSASRSGVDFSLFADAGLSLKVRAETPSADASPPGSPSPSPSSSQTPQFAQKQPDNQEAQESDAQRPPPPTRRLEPPVVVPVEAVPVVWSEKSATGSGQTPARRADPPRLEQVSPEQIRGAALLTEDSAPDVKDRAFAREKELLAKPSPAPHAAAAYKNRMAFLEALNCVDENGMALIDYYWDGRWTDFDLFFDKDKDGKLKKPYYTREAYAQFKASQAAAQGAMAGSTIQATPPRPAQPAEPTATGEGGIRLGPPVTTIAEGAAAGIIAKGVTDAAIAAGAVALGTAGAIAAIAKKVVRGAGEKSPTQGQNGSTQNGAAQAEFADPHYEEQALAYAEMQMPQALRPDTAPLAEADIGLVEGLSIGLSETAAGFAESMHTLYDRVTQSANALVDGYAAAVMTAARESSAAALKIASIVYHTAVDTVVAPFEFLIDGIRGGVEENVNMWETFAKALGFGNNILLPILGLMPEGDNGQDTQNGVIQKNWFKDAWNWLWNWVSPRGGGPTSAELSEDYEEFLRRYTPPPVLEAFLNVEESAYSKASKDIAISEARERLLEAVRFVELYTEVARELAPLPEDRTSARSKYLAHERLKQLTSKILQWPEDKPTRYRHLIAERLWRYIDRLDNYPDEKGIDKLQAFATALKESLSLPDNVMKARFGSPTNKQVSEYVNRHFKESIFSATEDELTADTMDIIKLRIQNLERKYQAAAKDYIDHANSSQGELLSSLNNPSADRGRKYLMESALKRNSFGVYDSQGYRGDRLVLSGAQNLYISLNVKTWFGIALSAAENELTWEHYGKLLSQGLDIIAYFKQVRKIRI